MIEDKLVGNLVLQLYGLPKSLQSSDIKMQIDGTSEFFAQIKPEILGSSVEKFEKLPWRSTPAVTKVIEGKRRRTVTCLLFCDPQYEKQQQASSFNSIGYHCHP